MILRHPVDFPTFQYLSGGENYGTRHIFDLQVRADFQGLALLQADLRKEQQAQA
jgi:hypothetical protein